jgi:hypothetical protein
MPGSDNTKMYFRTAMENNKRTEGRFIKGSAGFENCQQAPE